MRLHASQLSALIVALSIAGYPLVASLAAAFKLPSTQLSITMRGIILGLSLVLIIHKLRRPRHLPNLGVMILIMLFFYGLRLLVETVFESQHLGELPSQYWIWFLGVTTVPMLAILMSETLDPLLLRRQLVGMLAIAAMLIAFVGSSEGLSGETGRVALDALNPISVGNVGTSLAVLSIWELFGNRDSIKTPKLFWVLLLILGLYLLFISASRGPLVGAIAAMIVMGFSLRLKSRLWFIVGAPLLVAPAFLYLMTIEAGLKVNFLSRVTNIGIDRDMSLSVRTEIYASAFSLIKQYPIFGSAIEIQAYASYPHNFFLEYFMATGIFAGTFAFCVMIAVLLRATRHVKSGRQIGAFALLFIAAFLGTQFSGAVYSNVTLWLLAAVVVVAKVDRGPGHNFPHLSLSHTKYQCR